MGRDTFSSKAILLLQLGTPDAPTPKALRRYLRQFLSDRRVIRVPRMIWLPLLYGIILPFRAPKSAKLYQKIWRPEGSPLLLESEKIRKALQAKLPDTPVVLGMRYGEPSIAKALGFAKDWLDQLLVLPLFPQYSSTTTAAAFDGLAKTLRQWHNLPEVVFIRDYWREDGYLQALADSIQQFWNKHGRAQKLIFSFHGIPQGYVDAGDPYPNACMATALSVAQKLHLHKDQWLVAFQSRFGKSPWTRPYTDEILVELGLQGIQQADIVCPGFSVDCLETLEEINIRYREHFAEHGGTLRYIPALGAAPALIETFAHRLGAKFV